MLGNGQESSLSGVYMVDCMCELRARVDYSKANVNAAKALA